MPSILDFASRSLSGDATSRLAAQVGADPSAVERAAGIAMPLLVGALARNANRSKDDARALDNALERDHDGSLLDSFAGLLGGAGGGGLGGLLGGGAGGGGLLGGLLGGGANAPAIPGKAVDGDGILGHILGGRRSAVEQGVSKASGLDLGQVAKLLPLLAPLLMGALGKMKRERGLDADGVAAELNRERADVERQAEGMPQGGLLAMLDRDNDGQIMDDIAGMGASLAGAWLKNR